MAEMYAKSGGQGNRTSSITVTSTIAPSASANHLIDGGYANNSTDGWAWTSGQSGKAVTFDFGSFPKKITEALFILGGNENNGSLQLQASNDNSTWVNISPVLVTSGNQFYRFTSDGSNDGYYRYYRIAQVSGTLANSYYKLEVLFKLSGQNGEDSGVLAPSYDNFCGKGYRNRGIIVTSTTLGFNSGTPQTLLDGSYADVTWFAAESGKYIQFDFPDECLITELTLYQSAATNQGTWKWQGYDEAASSWVDLGSTFTYTQATEVVTAISAVTDYYKSYRMQQVSGTTSTSPYQREIEFKIGYSFDEAASGGARITQAAMLVVSDPPPVAKITQAAMLVVGEQGVVESRVTQLPVLVVDTSNQPVRVTQLPVLAIAVPVQGARVTQVPINVVNKPKPVPFPVAMVPDVPVREVWQWKTVVSVAEGSKEQRSALRARPRFAMKFDVILLDDVDRQLAYNLLLKSLGKKFSYPMYSHSVKLNVDAVAGDTKLYFDPSRTDMRAGEAIAFFDPYLEQTHMSTISTVDVDGATLATALEYDAPSYWMVCPAPEFRVVDQVGISMNSVDGKFTLAIDGTQARQVLRPNQTVTLPTIDDIIILDKRALASGEVDEKFDKNITWLDNEIAPPESRTNWLNPFVSGTRSFIVHRPTDMDYWRKFADSVKGMQKTFLLATFYDDIRLSVEPALGATTLRSADVQFYDYWRGRTWQYVRIQSNTGAIYRRINEVVAHYDENHDMDYVDIKLSSAIGASAGSNKNMKVSFAYRCRLDSDEITFDHDTLDSVVTINIRTVDE